MLLRKIAGAPRPLTADIYFIYASERIQVYVVGARSGRVVGGI
jgi:hypothetical protein